MKLQLGVVVTIAVLVFCASAVYGKRAAPAGVVSVVHEGVEYHAPREQMGCVEARDVQSKQLIWRRQIYVVRYELDLERDVLGKLRRSVPKLNVKYGQTKSTGLFGATESDNYGLIQYEYDGQRDQSYSNSENEILPIIYQLAGIRVVPAPVPAYRGYPLVADARGSQWWFYFVLPLLFLGAGIYGRRGKW